MDDESPWEMARAALMSNEVLGSIEAEARDCLQCYNFLLPYPLRMFDYCTTVHPSTHQPGDIK